MLPPVSSASSVQHPMLPQETLDNTNVSLEEIRNAEGNINQIRILLKGNQEALLSLFKEALKENDLIIQIQLSYTLFAMRKGKDEVRDFSTTAVENLETFFYYFQGCAHFAYAYKLVAGPTCNVNIAFDMAKKAFLSAANLNYPPALLQFIWKEWDGHKDTYGFAIQLLPFVGKGDSLLDYAFGKALLKGCEAESELHKQGRCWTRKPSDSLEKSHIEYQPPGDVNLIKPYLFKYDSEQVKSLLNKYKIRTSAGEIFVEHPNQGCEIESIDGKLHRFRINTLSVYKEDIVEHKTFGSISVRHDTFKIYQTFENSELKPVIEFIENVMTRTGSAKSAQSWLIQIKKGYDRQNKQYL